MSLKFISFDMNPLSTNKNYNIFKSNCLGEGNSNEITDSGKIELCIMAPCITPHEIDAFQAKIPTAYYFERENKSAMIFDFACFKPEIIINPSYYEDNRYELFKQGEKKLMTVCLIDSALDKVVALKQIILKGKVLDAFRKGLELNNKCTKNEYNDWISKTLYKHDFEHNIKTSIYLGKCYEALNVDLLN